MYLTDEGEDPDDVVDGVGEESYEDVPLPVDLPCVDLVEQGHHDECVEDHGEVNGGWAVQAGLLTVVHVKDFVAWRTKNKITYIQWSIIGPIITVRISRTTHVSSARAAFAEARKATFSEVVAFLGRGKLTNFCPKANVI